MYRYDLGSGAALIRSADKLQLNRFHTLVARRFRRDGVLRVDAGGEVSGTSRGMLRALNVMTPFYVGYLPNATAQSVIHSHSGGVVICCPVICPRNNITESNVK